MFQVALEILRVNAINIKIAKDEGEAMVKLNEFAGSIIDKRQEDLGLGQVSEKFCTNTIGSITFDI